MDKYEYCENIIKESSQSFYKAFSVLPEEKAKAVYAIYAFCRTVDDAIDVDHDIKKLNALEKNIKATFEGKAPDDLLFQALADTFEKYPSNVEPYLDLIDGMRDDYNNKPIKTEADLDKYCYKAAGTVGLMLLPVIASEKLKDHKEKLESVAVELGKGMQITNILRDVRDDFINDRVYFPDEIIEQYQLQIEITRTGLVTAEWRGMMEYYIQKAKDQYQVFYDHAELFDKDAILPTYLAARFYEAIMDQIEKRGYTNINKRHVVGKFRKWRISKAVQKTLSKRELVE